LLAAIDVNYFSCDWQDNEEENGTKEALPAGKPGLRSSNSSSPTASKRPEKKMTVRKKPTAQKTPSVTLTQMVGSSDFKRLQMVADTENVCRFNLLFYFVGIFLFMLLAD